MKRPSGDVYAVIPCLLMHYCGKVLIVCSQSLALERISQNGLMNFHQGLVMRVMAASVCGYFPVAFHQDFTFLCLLVITDLRPLRVPGQASQPLYGHLPALLP